MTGRAVILAGFERDQRRDETLRINLNAGLRSLKCGLRAGGGDKSREAGRCENCFQVCLFADFLISNGMLAEADFLTIPQTG